MFYLAIFTKQPNKIDKDMKITYLEIINFCANLTIPQLIFFKDFYRSDKNKEFIIACEVLKIRLKKNKTL